MRKQLVNSFAIGVVFVSAFVLGYIFYELSSAKQVFATQIVEQKAIRMRSELDEFFNPIQNLLVTLREHHSTSSFRSFDRIDLNLYYIPIIQEYSQISSIGLAHSSGYELNILPDSTNGFWLNREVFVDEWGMIEKWTKWQKTDSFTLVDSWETPLKVDPRNRSWFIGFETQAIPEIFWSQPYEYMTGQVGITSSLRYSGIQKPDEFNIIALDITLNDLSQFSQNLNLSDKDEIYILTEDLDEIIVLPQKFTPNNIKDEDGDILSSPNQFGNNALNKLIEFESNQIVSFAADNIKWWGILDLYNITNRQKLVVAALIPEQDFSARIDRTQNLMGIGFLIVLSLSVLLVRNNRKLKHAGSELTHKNNLINEQKQHLLSEVHHRVKNNLAIMSALMELENMMIDDPNTKRILNLIQSRILSMAAVHEVLYKSDKFNQISVQDILPGITNHFNKANPTVNITYSTQIEPVLINVNQALTYALLINECLNYFTKSKLQESDDGTINFNITNGDEKICTQIETSFKIDLARIENEIGMELITVLIAQLNADLTKGSTGEGVKWDINFRLEDKKGATSDRIYH